MLSVNRRQGHADIRGNGLPKNEDIIFKKPDLYYSKRSADILIIEPATGSWVILDDKHYKIFSTIDSHINFGAVLERNNDYSEEGLRNFVYILYKNNIISINDEYYFDENFFKTNYRLWPNLFSILVSDKCNLNCAYCYYGADKTGKIMSKETLHNVLKRIYEELPLNNSNYAVTFHGGEPLIAMDIIKEAHDYIKILDKKHGKFTILLCENNGTLLNEKNISLLKEMDVRIGVSIDGPEDIHDKYRVYSNGRGSFNEAFAGYKLAKNMGLSPGCIATIYDPEDMIKSFEFFINNGIHDFRLGIAHCFSGRSSLLEYPEDRSYKFAENFLKIVDMALEFNKLHPGVLHFADLDEMLNNIVVKTREFYMCLRSPCGAGNSIVCFTAEGDIYPCDCISGEKDVKIANISDKRPLYRILSESDIIQSLRKRTVWNIPKCKRCAWRNFCGANCAAVSYGTYKDMLRETPFCGFFKIVYEKLIWKLHDDGSLLDFLPKRFFNNNRGYSC